MFTDKTFPVGNNFLRPYEISSYPKFMVNKFEPSDIDQGELGNCWFLSALASIASNQELISKIVDFNQTCMGPSYTGKFKFNFYKNNSLITVEIDDRLPVYGGTTQLKYCRNHSEPDEYWVCLLEKAYAKFKGGYDKLDGGWPSIALYDLTGGVVETLNTNSLSLNKLEAILNSCFEKKSLINAGISGNGESTLNNGLISGHAYSVLQCYYIVHNHKQVALLLVRNPWGTQEGEWTDDYGDGAEIWKNKEFAALGKLCKEEVGSFFIKLEDFHKIFDMLFISHIEPTEKKIAIAGSLNCFFSVTPKNEADNLVSKRILVNVIKQQSSSVEFRYILFKCRNEHEFLNRKFVRDNCIFITSSGYFSSLDAVVAQVKVPPGNYMLLIETSDCKSYNFVYELSSSFFNLMFIC